MVAYPIESLIERSQALLSIQHKINRTFPIQWRSVFECSESEEIISVAYPQDTARRKSLGNRYYQFPSGTGIPNKIPLELRQHGISTVYLCKKFFQVPGICVFKHRYFSCFVRIDSKLVPGLPQNGVALREGAAARAGEGEGYAPAGLDGERGEQLQCDAQRLA